MSGSRHVSGLPARIAALLLVVSCLVPLAWLLWQIVAMPATLSLLRPSAIRWDILLRTCGYSAAAAAIACLLAIPAAIAIGRRQSRLSGPIALLLPVTLLLPSLMYAYGWAQFFRLLVGPLGRRLASLDVDRLALERFGISLVGDGDQGRMYLVNAGTADVARCILSLAAWLWPIPAAAMAWALRRADPQVMQQAALDGAAGRTAFRQALPAGCVAMLGVWVLASQEFAVYEPTGVSVVATEVRMVFETGSFSSPDNPITAPLGGLGGGAMFGANPSDPAISALPPAGPPIPSTDSADPRDVQQRAAAAAVATGIPMILLTLAAGAVVVAACRRWSAESDEVHHGGWSRDERRAATSRGRACLALPHASTVLSLLVIAVTVGVPVAAMMLRHQRAFQPVLIWKQSGDLVLGSLLIAALAGMAAAIVALGGLVRRPRWGVALALASFLVGGQLLAIALIRIYNRPGFGWVCNAPPILVMAYLGRFAWLALIAALATWTRPWRLLRQQAQLDGADAADVALRVVLPLAWPIVIAAGLLVLVFGLTEVPATVLAAPFRPPQIIPMLMTWVHTLESDPMIEASLLLASTAMLLTAAGVLIARRMKRALEDRGLTMTEARRPTPTRHPLFAILYPLIFILPLSAAGCGDPSQPDAVWMSTGTAPGQTVYPRAICYSKVDDTFIIVDRVARVQRLDRDGNHLGGWIMPESQYGKPVGISAGPDGNVYVPDTHYHRVMVYSPQGQLLRKWGSLGKEKGQFIFPTDVAFDEHGRVFVSEYGEHDRVQVFDDAGNYLYEFGSFGEGDGQMSRPQSMVIDKGLVYITDSCNHRLVVFRTDGTFVRNIGGVGSELGQFRFPYGLDIDADGRLVVCEFGNNRVQLIDKETGKGLKTWGGAGREVGQLAYPWGVAIDRKGRVVTVDSGNNRLQVFGF